eukprot:CAMPEP_0175733744 /NCGR_PEP_ID=MMETSP0097-20121207/52030_1 /TAXON_ID=311494 /ORGANISM="Alexandrium monilatum, Strain CCMP3105" /LENGTH=70 /DNA_ID=CAMNT_0017041753 /DNA_START=486 /DNA_END=694 /DNA_ORIENTATION=-
MTTAMLPGVVAPMVTGTAWPAGPMTATPWTTGGLVEGLPAWAISISWSCRASLSSSCVAGTLLLMAPAQA